MSPITFRHNPDRSRFEVLDGDTVIGRAAYVDRVDEGQRIFYHTVINDEYEGQGLAGRLAAQALDGTVAAGLRIVPVCPYIKKYLQKHPGYSANVQKPTPAILEFLSAFLEQRARR
jgi:predicted GNAT family acetyltransferase